MNQEDLQKRNDLLSQISALKASIAGLELTGNKEYNDLIKGNKDALKVVEKEFAKFEKDMEKQKQAEIEAKQKARVKQIDDDLKVIADYLKYVGGLKIKDNPDLSEVGKFKAILRRPHVVRRLKVLGLK